ncbi:MAG TPA: flavohemoglobin expression-modulating QEGLA motif protein [Polyangia bacterium]|nr:flavohemoglobin expression-modulating QEGLA motif protein [Polyangia bacterium]
MALSSKAYELLRSVSAEILEAQRPLRVLRALAWTDEAERAFFASGARELPRPEYRLAPEVGPAGERFRVLKAALAGGGAIEAFLRETCDAFSTASRMLLAVGTKDFYYHSVELYGRPASLTADRRTTNLDLAQHFAQVVDGVVGTARIPSAADEETLTAEEVMPILARRFARFFQGAGISVEVVDGLASKAAAGVDGVRLQRGARFSQRDLLQLEYHEGHVHVATALNGRAQPVLAFTGYPSPRTTATQEGLAVLTEFLTQSTSLERLRRLSDRTLAIKMAEDGADFCELYRFFLGRGHDEAAAYDCARRVCRGGLVTGGAPFTKDVCYLDGLLRVTNFLRVALVKGHLHHVPLFFAGKIDVQDVPLFGRLLREGAVVEPKFVPAWARDLSYLTAFMSYSAFLGECDLSAERRRYEDLIGRADDQEL